MMYLYLNVQSEIQSGMDSFDLTDLQLVPLPTFQVDGRRFGKVLSSFPKHIYILIGLKLTREKIRLLQRKMLCVCKKNNTTPIQVVILT